MWALPLASFSCGADYVLRHFSLAGSSGLICPHTGDYGAYPMHSWAQHSSVSHRHCLRCLKHWLHWYSLSSWGPWWVRRFWGGSLLWKHGPFPDHRENRVGLTFFRWIWGVRYTLMLSVKMWSVYINTKHLNTCFPITCTLLYFKNLYETYVMSQSLFLLW